MDKKFSTLKNSESYLGRYLVIACPMTHLEYNNFRGWELPRDENPSDAGFILQDDEGYVTWLPVNKFEERFNLVEISESENT